MALFKEEDLGKPIEDKISNYLKMNTSRKDIAKASTLSGVGTSTIRDVAFGYNSLTESNSKGIEQLLIIAKENFTQKINASSEVNQFLEQNLI